MKKRFHILVGAINTNYVCDWDVELGATTVLSYKQYFITTGIGRKFQTRHKFGGMWRLWGYW